MTSCKVMHIMIKSFNSNRVDKILVKGLPN